MLPIQSYILQQIDRNYIGNACIHKMQNDALIKIQAVFIVWKMRNSFRSNQQHAKCTNIGLKTRGNITLNPIWLNVTWTDGLCVYSLSSNIWEVHFRSQITVHNRSSSSCEDRTGTVTMLRKAGICEWDGTGLHSTFQSLALSLSNTFASFSPHYLSFLTSLSHWILHPAVLISSRSLMCVCKSCSAMQTRRDGERESTTRQRKAATMTYGAR